MLRCKQIVKLLYPFTIWEHYGYLSLSAFDSQNEVILGGITIFKSHLMTFGFMLEITFGLLTVRTPEEYLHSEMLTVPILEEYNTVCAFCEAVTFRRWVRQHLA